MSSLFPARRAGRGFNGSAKPTALKTTSKHPVSSQGDTLLRIPSIEDERNLHHAYCGTVIHINASLSVYLLYCLIIHTYHVHVYQIFWALGTVFEVLLALWVMPTLGWRWLLGFSALPLAIFVGFCPVSTTSDP